MFVQTVSLEGSEWGQTVEDELNLVQSYWDHFATEDENELSLIDTAIGQVARAAVAISELDLTEVITFAGCLCGEGGSGSLTTIEAIFDSTMQSGMAIYVSGDGHVDLAQADDLSTSIPVGLATTDTLADEVGEYLTCTPITLDDWTAVIGTQFLSPGSIYFLSQSDAGHMTTDAPDQTGEYVIIMGSALTQTTFNIEVHRAYLVG